MARVCAKRRRWGSLDRIAGRTIRSYSIPIRRWRKSHRCATPFAMGLYTSIILPKVLDLACAVKPNSPTARKRSCPSRVGEVVEIGIGSGLNLPFYDPDRVTRVIGIDPDEALWARGAERLAACAFPVERLGLSGESLPLDDGCADTVLVTYALCTVPDPGRGLARNGPGSAPRAAKSCSPSTVARRIAAWPAGRPGSIRSGAVWRADAIPGGTFPRSSKPQGCASRDWKRCTFPARKC